MVVISEAPSMFWGVTLYEGKRYTQTVTTSFHVSMAALEPTVPEAEYADQPYVSVYIQHEKAEFLLCSLKHGSLLQQDLDLNFTEGEEITLFTSGKGVIHLTGYLTLDQDQPFDEDEDDDELESDEEASDEEDSDEEIPSLVAADDDDDEDTDEEEDDDWLTPAKGKRKKKQKIKEKKKLKLDEDDDDDDDDDDEEDMDEDDEDEDDSGDEEGVSFGELEFDEDDSDEDDSFDDEADMSGSFSETFKKAKKQKSDKKIEEVPKAEKVAAPQAKSAEESASKKKKKNKKKKKDAAESPKTEASPQVEEASTENGVTAKKKKKSKKEKQNADSQAGQTPKTDGKKEQKTSKSPKKKVLSGGIVMEELKEGHGPEAKPRKMIHMYYKGSLVNGKEFDSTLSGKPFNFRLGSGEVIQGWDVGVQGMKVGGKRKLTIPAKMAYGKQRVGEIPANSTLVFECELKAVS